MLETALLKNPTEIVVNDLSKECANLLPSEGIFNVLFNKLTEIFRDCRDFFFKQIS